MTTRSWWISAAVAMTVATVPITAQAQAPCGSAGYTYTLGLGASLTGCFTGVLTQLGEDAGFISDQYY